MSTTPEEMTKLLENLQGFVKYGVTSCEKKLINYQKEADPMENVHKKGTVTKVFAGAGSVAGAGGGMAAAATGIPALIAASKQIGTGLGKAFSEVVDYVSAKKHKRKAKKVYQIFRKLQDDERRRLLVECFVRIFIAFEYQFRQIEVTENYKRNFEKVAFEILNKMINFVFDSYDAIKNEAITCKLITEGGLCGRSKGIVAQLPPVLQTTFGMQPGQKYENANDSTNISELLEEVGIAVIQDESFSLYKKNNKRNGHLKFEYRLRFDWEDPSNDEAYVPVEDEKFQYSYILVKEDVNKIIDDLIKLINDADTKVKMGEIDKGVQGVKKGVDDLTEVTRNTHEETRELLQDIKKNIGKRSTSPEILRNVRFGMKKSVRGFTGREEEIRKLHDALHSEPTDTAISRVAVICGLGGIGKSELCRR